MKKVICVFLSLAIVMLFAGCGASDKQTPAKNAESVNNDTVKSQKAIIDVDLTKLSSTVVYSEVYNMMSTPEDYFGKTVKMSGQFAVYQALDENGSPVEGAPVYYACVIADATACCQQGLEFVLEGDYAYPDDYPELGSEITVSGEFETYKEGENTYCHLINAKFE